MCGNAWLLSLYTFNMTGLPTCTPTVTIPDTNTTIPGTNTTIPDANTTTVIDGSTTVLPSATVSLNASMGFPSANVSITGSILPSADATSIVLPSANATSIILPSANASVTVSVTARPTSTLPVYENEADQSIWYTLGCAIEGSSGRILTGYSGISISDLTIDKCLSLCEDKGFNYAGVEYGEECYCGNSIPATIAYSASSCSMACKGDSTETCGGDWALDLYELASSVCDNTTTTSAAPSTSGVLVVIPTIASSSSSPVATVVPGVSSATAISSAAATTVVPSSVVVSSAAVSSAAVTSVAVSSVAASPVSTAAPSPSEVPSSSDTHYVWAHHMVGNTYPYGVNDWLNDVNKASAYGIDGFALNMGSDYWQPARIADAYTAAQNSGTGFKLFLSLDMTVMSCGSASDGNTLVNLVKTFANHPNQALVNGKVLVSTFAGSDCTFGTGNMQGWKGAFVDALQSAGVDIFFVPSIFADPSTFSSIGFMDGELNWNSAWPLGDYEISTASDERYINALAGKEYMAAISPFFFTHFGANSWNKNWLYRSDNWLYATRWEQLIAQRQSIKSLEILTWNDYGESSYIGPIAGALPSGSEVWVNGFDHEGINILTKYYSTAFKTGQYPTITKDSIVMWQRPHAHDAIASNDGAGRPTGWDWTDDNLYAVVLTTGPATVTLTSGSNTETFSVQGGLSKLKVASAEGAMSGSIIRSGSTVASYASSGSVYTKNPSTYNYNYYLGSSS